MTTLVTLSAAKGFLRAATASIPSRDRLPLTARSGVKGEGAGPRSRDQGSKGPRDSGAKKLDSRLRGNDDAEPRPPSEPRARARGHDSPARPAFNPRPPSEPRAPAARPPATAALGKCERLPDDSAECQPNDSAVMLPVNLPRRGNGLWPRVERSATRGIVEWMKHPAPAGAAEVVGRTARPMPVSPPSSALSGRHHKGSPFPTG